jgi:hypothetical protein
MAETIKKWTVKDCLRFFLTKNPTLSSYGKTRVKRAIATLYSEGVDIGSLCRRVISLRNLPNEKPSTILSRFSRPIKGESKRCRKTFAQLQQY